MKDIVTPVPPEEVRSTIKKSLENAALDNYTRLSAEAKIEGTFVASNAFKQQQLMFVLTEDLRGEMMVPAAKKLEDLIHLAELCVDLLQQNEEHYAEVSRANSFKHLSDCGFLFLWFKIIHRCCL